MLLGFCSFKNCYCVYACSRICVSSLDRDFFLTWLQLTFVTCSMRNSSELYHNTQLMAEWSIINGNATTA